jgi:IclR family transcriptional regulator, KDG regulon repressor
MKVIKSVSKAIDILELFSDKDLEISLGEISKSLKIDEATVSHIVSTLVMQGFLKQNFKRGKYSLGVRFLDLSGTIGSNTENKLSPFSCLFQLSQQVNGSVHLNFWNNADDSLNQTCDHSADYLKVTPYNQSERLHKTATGKLILSGMPEEDLKKYFHHMGLSESEPGTINNIDYLKDVLSVVKRENIAFDMGDNVPGLNAIAAGIKNKEEVLIGALFVIAPSNGLTVNVINKIIPSLKACALTISRDFGYIY